MAMRDNFSFSSPAAANDLRPLDEGDGVGGQVVVQSPGSSSASAEPVEVEVGDGHSPAVALADRERRRGDRLGDAERAAAPRTKVVFPAPDRRRPGRRRPVGPGGEPAASASVSAAGSFAVPSRRPKKSSWSAGGLRARPREARAARAAAPSSSLSAAKSSSSSSLTRGAEDRRRMEDREDVEGALAERVDLRLAANLRDPGLVAGDQLGREVPSVAITFGSISSTCEQVGAAGLDLAAAGRGFPEAGIAGRSR